MKKLLIFVIALLVLTTAVSAVLTMPGDVLLGSESERRSNPNADDDDYHEYYAQTTFTLLSSVNAAGTQVSFEGVDAKYNAVLSTDGTTWSNTITVDLVANTQKIIYVKAKVPADLDAIDTNFALLKSVIGKIKATAGAETKYSDIKMQAANKLIVDKVKVCINDGSCESLDDTENVQDIKPGDKVTIEVTVENKYSDNDRENLDIDVNDVTVESDGGELEDFDDSEDLGDISAEESDSVTFDLEVDSDADKGNYDINIMAKGEDENGATHGEMWTITLEVEREKHELSIYDMILEPAQVNCGETATLNVDIKNIGRNDEDDVSVLVKSVALSNLYQKAEYVDSVDQDDEESFVFYINVPERQTAGQYRIDVQSYYSKTTVSGKDSILLTVACEAEEEEIVEPIEFVQPGASAKAILSVPVTFSVKGAAHTLSVSSYDTTTESAVVVLASTPQTVSLAKGVPQRVDLERDGQDDLVVTLLGVSKEGVLTVQLQQITVGTETPNMVITGGYTGTTQPTGAVVTEPSVFSGLFDGSSYVVTLVIIDVIILVVAIVLISKALSKR